MREQLLHVARDLQDLVVRAIPRLVVGIGVVVALLVAAKLLERFLRTVLLRANFDARLQQLGIDKTLHRIGIRDSLSLLLPKAVYYLLLLLFARTAADAFGLTAVSDGIAAMFAYLPNIVAAILLVVVGASLGQFAGRTVTTAAEESGIEFARPLGSLVSGGVLFMAGIMAVSQLRIDTEMVRIVTICTLSGLALAFGLSLGLGSRDITRNVLAGFYARKVFTPGDALMIRGERGVLKAITTTQTLIEQDTGLMVVANSVFFDEAVRH